MKIRDSETSFRRIDSFMGCPLSYRVEGSGPPVIFIQGVGARGDGRSPHTDVLSSSLICLTRPSLDYRGMGKSGPAAGRIPAGQMALYLSEIEPAGAGRHT